MLKTLGAAIPLGAILQTGCQSASATLEEIITATSAAVDIGFPQYAALLNPYFTSVTKFIDQVTTELASADTSARKAAAIAGFAAAIVEPNLSGVASTVVERVLAIAPLIAQLVSEIQSARIEIPGANPGANAFFASKHIKPPSARDLERIRAKNAKLKARLAQASVIVTPRHTDPTNQEEVLLGPSRSLITDLYAQPEFQNEWASMSAL
jgi:hypothetical protein